MKIHYINDKYPVYFNDAFAAARLDKCCKKVRFMAEFCEHHTSGWRWSCGADNWITTHKKAYELVLFASYKGYWIWWRTDGDMILNLEIRKKVK